MTKKKSKSKPRGKKKAYTPKSTQIEIERRLDELEPLLLRGLPRRSIIQYGTKTWKIKPREIDEYMRKIKDRWLERQEPERKRNLAEAIEKRFDMYFEARKNSDIKSALEIEKDLRKLQGLYVEDILLTQNTVAELTKDEIIELHNKTKEKQNESQNDS
jgi:hypothetical protein